MHLATAAADRFCVVFDGTGSVLLVEEIYMHTAVVELDQSKPSFLVEVLSPDGLPRQGTSL